jgi:hypothetical protein
VPASSSVQGIWAFRLALLRLLLFRKIAKSSFTVSESLGPRNFTLSYNVLFIEPNSKCEVILDLKFVIYNLESAEI